MECTLDVPAIFRRLNGPQNIADLLTAAGHKTSRQAVTLWLKSGVIPMGKWLALKAIAAERRIHLNLDDYIVTTGADHAVTKR